MPRPFRKEEPPFDSLTGAVPAAGWIVVGWATLPSISVEADGDGSGARCVSGADLGCGGRLPKRTAEMARVNSLPSA